MGADVVAVGASLAVAPGDAVHAPLASLAADPGAERVAAAGLTGGHLRVAGVAALSGDGLGGVPGARSIKAGWDGCGDQSHSAAGTGRFLPWIVRLRPNTMYPVYFGLRRMPVRVFWVHPVPSGDG